MSTILSFFLLNLDFLLHRRQQRIKNKLIYQLDKYIVKIILDHRKVGMDIANGYCYQAFVYTFLLLKTERKVIYAGRIRNTKKNV